jgi:hypothetical protein
MGTSLAIADLEKVYRSQLIPPVSINMIDDTDETQAKRFNEMVFTVYSGEVMDTLISCDCGKVTSKANEGVVCPNCRTPAIRRNETTGDTLMWFDTPKGLPPMINPKMLEELDLAFKYSSFSFIRYLVDSTYRPKVNKNIGKHIDWIHAQGWKRGYRFFYEHYDEIIETLCENRTFKKKAADIRAFCKLYREVTFVNHIPLPNKSLMIIEENHTGIYRERSIEKAIDAARTIVGIDLEVKRYSLRTKENRMIKAIYLLFGFVTDYITNVAKGKEGMIRKNMIAGRTYFTGRAVISSITGRLRHDELEVPWGIGLSLLRLHLSGKLVRLGLTTSEAGLFLDNHAHKYHPLLGKMVEEIVDEAKSANGRGLGVFFCRNPSLLRGSIFSAWVPRIKTDVTDQTIGIPANNVRSTNADFDGDQCPIMLMLDQEMAIMSEAFAPHKNVLDSSKYRRLSDCFAITKPVALNIGTWYRDNDEIMTTEQEEFAKQLA